MKKTITVDTNLLLDDEKIIFKLLNEYEKIIIPITVLKELDKHKFNPNLSFSARNAIRALKEFKTKYPDQIDFPISDHDISKNDARLLKQQRRKMLILQLKTYQCL
jgi:predicted ribonuclease YlaK